MFKALIKAARLRTLPLAIAGISLGAILAAYFSQHNWAITWWAISTAIWLQILSNFANDYGDYTKGLDDERDDRVLGSGAMRLSHMKVALWILTALCMISGIILLYTAFGSLSGTTLMFFATGLICIYAAVKYTAGKNPYGYSGFGDVAVFIFFGLVAVLGTYFLQTSDFDRGWWLTILPASAFGLLSAGVLNVNNIRDIETDERFNKITVAVILGIKKALLYQLFLIIISFILLVVFMWQAGDVLGWSIWMLLPVYLWHWLRLRHLQHNFDRQAYNGLLKNLVLLNLLLVAVFGLTLLF